MLNTPKYDFIDVHYHANPDLYLRNYHSLEAGRLYQKLNGAVVLKSHLGSTAIQATIAQQEGLPVFPSVVLNESNGGIHYRVISRALAQYQPVLPFKMIVHFPTITKQQHNSKLKRQIANPQLSEHLLIGSSIVDQAGKLKKQVIDVLKFASDNPIVLSTGHASKKEVYALIDACERWKVPALFLNQPASPLTNLNYSELKQIAQANIVWFEQTALTFLLGYQQEEDFRQVLQALPRVIYSSDLGQTSQIDIPEWLSKSETWFTKFAISKNRKREICLLNPLQLMKI